MKTFILVVSCLSAFWFCHSKAEQQPDAGLTIAVAHPDSINFKTQLQPVLRENCSPCHFPGGKMYERMPFDQGETILHHAEKIVRRFSKKEKELALITQFIEQEKK